MIVYPLVAPMLEPHPLCDQCLAVVTNTHQERSHSLEQSKVTITLALSRNTDH